METRVILEECVSMLYDDLAKGTTVELFKAMYPHPLDDIGNISENIQNIDQHTARSITDKIDRALMDLRAFETTCGEALMFRLRLENAIRMLTILSRAKVPCEVNTNICEESLVWSLTTLWAASSAQWAYLTAQAFCEGRSSALPLPSRA